MQIDVYSKDNCGQCNQVKSLIKQKCLEYNEYMLGKDVQIEDLKERVASVNSDIPLRSAPQIFVDSKHIGGYQDFVAWLSYQENNCSLN